MNSVSPSSPNNPWFAISIGLMGIIVGFFIGTYSNPGVAPGPQQVAVAPSAPTPPTPPPAPETPATVDDDPIEGAKNAKVTVIEFTDFQCPFCSRHYTDTYGQIKKDYVDTGKIKYVVRDFPLSFHPNAEPAAIAAGCANDQGKFWEMHDKLFTNQATWSNMGDAKPTFKQYAADIKLDTAKFNSCLDNGEHKDEIQKDEADGIASGINGTPGFWVVGADGKGQLISGAVPYASFKQAIDALL